MDGMEHMKYEEQVRFAIKKTLSQTGIVEVFDVERNLSEIGVDSISFVRIMIELEDIFGIEFPFEELVLSESGTISNICKTIKSIKG